MTSANQGGRPRNAWTPARERKLVRLYTLTNLSKDEIKRILEGSDFNPSTSDIQKKLRALFPKDYAKEHKRFRPSAVSNMELRLRRIRQCGGGRVSKARKRPRSKAMHYKKRVSLLLSRQFPNEEPSVMGNSQYAFRDHSSHTKVPDTHALLKPICPDSFPTIPEHLLLDGSTVHPMSTVSVPQVLSTSQLIGNSSVNEIGRNSTASSSLLSIRSIARRLARPYSRAYLEHIRSVLRSSCSDSWRSSLLSMQSRGSSRNSFTSIPIGISTNLLTVPQQHNPMQKIPTDDEVELPYPRLTEHERCIWGELVDESRWLGPEAYLGPRLCCNSLSFDNDFFCKKCGFSSFLYSAITVNNFHLLPTMFVKLQDLFGNTFLHYAVAVSQSMYTHLDHLDTFASGSCGNILTKNTFGQTFLHLMQLPEPSIQSCVKYLIDVLFPKLVQLGASFMQRDYHGRTPAHAILRNAPQSISMQDLESLLLYFIPDIYAYDIFGERILDVIRLKSACSAETGIPFSSDWTMRSKFDYIKPTPLYYTAIFSETNSNNISQWLDFIKTHELENWVDLNGDTPLIAILKTWNLAEKEKELLGTISQLLKLGAEIHMRDRKGDTALTIATVRGFRACVRCLLSGGANISCRGFDGVGILERASLAMTVAKESGNQKLYSRILTSVNLLIDSGAKACPSECDEWVIQSTPEKTDIQRKADVNGA